LLKDSVQHVRNMERLLITEQEKSIINIRDLEQREDHLIAYTYFQTG